MTIDWNFAHGMNATLDLALRSTLASAIARHSVISVLR